MSYKDLQKEWVRNSGVKVGDTVKCIANPSVSTGDDFWVEGWDDLETSWVSGMNVGDTGTVCKIDDTGVAVTNPMGIVQLPDDSTPVFYYPFFVLIKVNV